MQLSALMKLPNWAGMIRSDLLGPKPMQLHISDCGHKLVFRTMGATYLIEDQRVRMLDDGAIFIRVRSKGRMIGALPSLVRIHLIDTSGRVILGTAVNEVVPEVKLQGYYGNSHMRLMA